MSRHEPMKLEELNPSSTQITRTSIFGMHAITVHVPYDQMLAAVKNYVAVQHCQNAFPFLNAEQREFIMTGMQPEQQEIIFGSVRDN